MHQLNTALHHCTRRHGAAQTCGCRTIQRTRHWLTAASAVAMVCAALVATARHARCPADESRENSPVEQTGSNIPFFQGNPPSGSDRSSQCNHELLLVQLEVLSETINDGALMTVRLVNHTAGIIVFDHTMLASQLANNLMYCCDNACYRPLMKRDTTVQLQSDGRDVSVVLSAGEERRLELRVPRVKWSISPAFRDRIQRGESAGLALPSNMELDIEDARGIVATVVIDVATPNVRIR